MSRMQGAPGRSRRALTAIVVLAISVTPVSRPAVFAEQRSADDARYLAARLAEGKLGIWRTSAALKALEEIGGPAVPSLIALLDGPAAQNAARVLGKIGDERAIEPLITMLGRDGANGLIAADALGEIGLPAVAPLLNVLGTAGARRPLRRHASRALGKIGDARAVPALMNEAFDASESYAAIIALGQIGTPALRPALAALEHPETARRTAAAGVLGAIADPIAVPALIKQTMIGGYGLTHATLAALGRIKDPRAVGPLIELLKRSMGREVLQLNPIDVIDALGEIGDESAVDALLAAGAASFHADSVVEALGKIGDPRAVEYLTGVLASGGYSAGKAATALGHIGDRRAVGPLMKLVRAEVNSTDVLSPIEASIGALGEIGDSQSIPTLISALESGGRATPAAEGALAKIGAPALPALWDRHRSSMSVSADRRGASGATDAIARTVGRVRDAAAVMPLITALRDADRGIRSAAAVALGEIADTRAVAPLLDVVGENDFILGSVATTALSRIGKPGVLSLLEALPRSTGSQRRAVIDILGRIGDERAIDPLFDVLSDPEAWTVTEALGSFGPRVVDRIAEILATGGPDLRVRAIGVLEGVLRRIVLGFDTTAGQLVFRALGDPDGRVQYAAVRVVASLDDPRTLGALTRRLEDADVYVRFGAVAALGDIGDRTVVKPLLARLDDRNREVRYQVGTALAKIGDPDATALLGQALKTPDLQVIAAAHEFFILKGYPASEPALISALDTHGDVLMARTFSRSGNDRLRQAADQWVSRRATSFPPDFSSVPPYVTWGRLR